MTIAKLTVRSEAQGSLNARVGCRTHTQQIVRHVDHTQYSTSHQMPRHTRTVSHESTTSQLGIYQQKLLTSSRNAFLL